MSKAVQRTLVILVTTITAFIILSFLKISKTYEILDDISTQSYITNRWLELTRDKLKDIETTLSNIDTNVFDTSLDVHRIKGTF